MAVVVTGPRAPSVDGPAVAHRQRLSGLSPHWPLWIAVPGLVVFWALGMGLVARIVVIVPISLQLLMQRRLRVPPRFGWFLLFVAFALLSTLQLPPQAMVNYLFLRGGEYVAGVLFVLHVYNVRPPGEGVEWLRRLLLWLWLSLVVLGLMAFAFPFGELPSLSQRLLPAALANDPFIQQVTTPALAQVQLFLGFELPRPSAPFPYTNGWGSAFSLLLPFVIATAASGPRRDKLLARVGLALSVVPAVMSVNRAMWGSVVLVLLYLVVSARDPALRRSLRRATAASSLVLVVALSSPLGEVASSRLDNPHSNSARTDLAIAVGEQIVESPWIGKGRPVEYQGPGIRPPIGTQGHLWWMLVGHGLPATLFFLVYFTLVLPTLRGPRMGLYARATVLAMFLQLPFYDMLSGELHLVLLAVAGAQLEVARATRPGDEIPS